MTTTLETELWQPAVKLRGTVAPAEYKNYVLPLLFIRYLSLRYEQRYEQLELLIKDPKSDYYTGDPEEDRFILNDPAEYTSHNVFIIPEEARWDYLRRHARSDDIKIKLDTAMRKLEESLPRLQGLLPPIYARSNLTVDQVADLINLFSKELFSQPDGSDLLGRAYMYFISNFASTEGNRGGEFFTPQAIVKLLVQMLAPRQGVVFDPAAGSGGMFIQADEFTQNSSLSFYGQERIGATLRLAKMNLFIHNLDGDIKLGNSLLNDQFPMLRADIIITNPPFNLQQWGADKLDGQDARLTIGYRKGQATDGNANYMWMMHYLYHLADGGTAGFVMANGAMTSNTTAERATREALLEEGFIDCVVQLPDKLFPSTGIPCCLFFLSKNRTGTHGYRARQEQVCFIDARSMGEMLNRRQRSLTEAEIERIAAVYHTYRSPRGETDLPDEAGFCTVASLEQIRQYDYKLTPGIYVGTQVDDEETEPYEEKMPRLVDELRDLFTQSNDLQTLIVDDLEGLV